LEVATKNLAPRAAVKVREDITEHVELSMEHHVAQGMDELEARVLAVKELGEAKHSKQQFEKAYLTQEELGKAEKEKEHAVKSGWFALVFLAILILYATTYRAEMNLLTIWASPLFLVSNIFWHGTRWWAAKTLNLTRYFFSQLLIQPIVFAGYIISFANSGMFPTSSLWGYSGLVLLVFVLILFLFAMKDYFAKWQKSKASNT
jgi:cation transport ATPase